jgi:alpha-L-rhamnosidase
MPITVCAPTFEHHREALGIGESSPRISWRFAGDSETQDWSQKSYEIEISRYGSDEVSNLRTESFRVASSESVLAPWPSTPLKSRQSARVRIRANSTENVYTPWSEYSVVETGLLTPEDWTAQVVAAEKILASTGALQPTLFRKSFDLEKKSISKARLYITSYGVYEPSVNGKRVGDHQMAPAWQSYGHRLSYQTFDVTKHLNQKKNVIGVEVSDGWWSGRLAFGGGRRFIYGDALAVLAQIDVLYEDGTTTTIGSDDTWKTSTGARIASEIYDGEIYDASLEIKDWNKPTFKEDGWKPVSLLEFPNIDLIAPEGPPIRVTETVKPKMIWKSPTDKVIVDFGQNLVGGVRLCVSGPKGTKITLQHTEVLEHGEVATRPLRDCKALDTVILSEDKLNWEPKFTFHGFRYVQVDGWPSKTGEPAAEDIEAFVIHTDMEPTGWFETSESIVNQLYSNIRWGMRGNFVGLPTDW